MNEMEDVWRREAPHVLAALLRRHGDLADCEDAAAEAAVAAVQQWPSAGLPDDPRAWLITVASRRLIDRVRSDSARRRREAAETAGADEPGTAVTTSESDDSLQMLLLCCHPALSRPSQVALALRSVGGLTVEQISAAYLVPARTMTQRLTRARATLREAGATFTWPSAEELPARVAAVLDACYLMFNEGYTRTAGPDLLDPGLAGEAVRLTRLVHEAVPDHAEATGALALMLLTQARAPARVDAAGDLVPLAEQDRTLWDTAAAAEGLALTHDALRLGHVGPFQVQAAIASLHVEAATAEQTDWTQISLLYATLSDLAPGPAVTLNRAVAVGMARGPEAGLGTLAPLLTNGALARHHRLHAVHAHLLELAGDTTAAATAYDLAIRYARSVPEQRYLGRRLAALTADPR
ncbi:MAG: sigma-70 family RNA polymerase sigma factor [Nocardioides sp.]|nr:sigma-70 family RNA polymerase sigma factor [Nocardioides sp.]